MSTSFLGINMSGRNLNVLNSNGDCIGVLYKKERFTYSFDLKTINGEKCKKIWFLNSSGNYVEGFLYDNYPISNWMHHRFYNSTAGYHFKVDGTAQIFNENGYGIGSCPPGSMVIPIDNAKTGYNNKHLLGIKKVYIPFSGNYVELDYESCFINTGVSYNSSNTIVYGNWN